ncbi:DNA polymerase III subunit alpha [Candidatus Berkiella cookevillensis]|uniref:DNA polymerase III subunit alpha n=1 Tax=Candidatus Berkiella cookevillensis TaxID=437022 RepID=A0A0Q9YSZ5_9GAMM|nr:DNA polymerase III subunit alpha [Candidatus Berkiella cookevillensis]MCS5708371.1 DNA polymerase III subunit alpha [Candidatus Berkiella cookevillensis]
MSNHKFIHLSVHSEYSIFDSIVRLDDLCETAVDQEIPALCVTDLCNLFATVKFFKKAISKGIQPIIGAEIWLESHLEHIASSKIILLCQNKIGYLNLTKLITACYKEGKRLKLPLAKYKWIKNFNEGLIAIAKGYESDIAQLVALDKIETAEKCIQTWQEWFGDRFYCGLTRYNHNPALEKKIISVLQKYTLAIVALNDVVFIAPTEHEAHEARVCIQEGATLEQQNRLSFSKEQYFKSPKEMADLFHDLPSSIENTVQIAKRCAFFLELGAPALPNFPVPEGETEESFIEKESFKGLEQRLKHKFLLQKYSEEAQIKIKQDYEDRLKVELAVINKMGFPGYFLIVADFIQWAKAHDIPVGPGRGSGAGSLVAYALLITDIDPIDYELLFERFLNPERVSMPDFDVDFCMDKRDNVIEYVAERYGRDSVSQISTFGTMAAKAVVRDVGRVLGHPYGFVDQIAKLIPFELGITLDKALAQEEALQAKYDTDEEVKILIDLAKKLEGIIRNVGKHAGGVVIAPSALSDFAPLYCEEGSEQTVTQFDKDDAETVGLVKFDFLGLRTLTIIHWAVKNVNKILEKSNKTPIDINHIKIDDPTTFKLLKKCQTTAVFQLESHGMKELIKRLSPDQFEEIIALVALFRPGPLQSGMVDDFINRKHGRAEVVYPHEKIAPILKPTYGVILYQEQVMQIAQVLAGYSLGQADLLRRAMGKKKPEEMAKQRADFVTGSVEREVDKALAESIFDLMEKFAGYGFNKSHSAAYALVAYQTAWLKAHFPACYMAAVLSADLNHTDKIVKFIDECRDAKLKVIPPNINICNYFFTVGDNQEILYGLGAIKGAGESAIRNIIDVRNNGPFKDLFEFCQRVDLKKVTRRVLEPLIKAGAFDCLGEDRGTLLGNLNDAIKEAENTKKDTMTGQIDLFSDQLFSNEVSIKAHYTKNPDYLWSVAKRLQFEKDALGLYFSGHPIEVVAHELSQFGVVTLRSVMTSQKDQKKYIAGLVMQVRTLQTKKGDRMAFVTLDDQSARTEIALFSDLYQSKRDVVVKDNLIIIEAEIGFDRFRQAQKIRAQSIFTMDELRARKAKYLKITVHENKFNLNSIALLKNLLEQKERGTCSIVLEFQKLTANGSLKFNERWNIAYSTEIVSELKTKVKEIDAVEVVY